MALQLLKQHLLKQSPLSLLTASGSSTADITEATQLALGDENDNDKTEVLPLDADTDFIVDGKPVPLRIIAYCWLNKDLSAAELLNDSTAKNIQALSFLQRNDLVNWLQGAEESEYIKRHNTESSTNANGATATGAAADATTTTSAATTANANATTTTTQETDDPLLTKILSNERDLIDHNSSLRGFKPVDFYNVGRECEIKIIKQLKRSKPDSSSSTNSASAKKTKDTARPANPIILISPAASALLSLANIKAFLQDSIYVDPNTNDPALQEHLSDPTAVRNISHHFSKLNKKFTFLVVNNTDRFTRPEYWDRVVAIFSTGQEWQFKNYKWSNPKELFQKIKGYYFYYKGDTVPQNVKEWNVQKIPIDRLRRFKDAEVLNYFWDEVEKSLVQRGF